MDRKNIAFFDAKPYDIAVFDEINKRYGYAIKYFENRLTEDTAQLVSGYQVVCVFVNDSVSKEVIDTLRNNGVELVALRSAGYNNVDIAEAYEKLHVVRVPEYSPYAVAEHTVALILSLNRNIHRAYNRTRESNFTLKGLMGFDLHGRTVGVIGTGKIGKTLIRIVNGFGMRILAYDIYPDNSYSEELGFSYVDLDTLYAESDIITLNCPLTPETYHIIDAESIAKMKQGVMLINTGRGPLLDTTALIEGLKTRKIGSAGLDVYEEESQYFFEDFSNEVIEDDELARLLSFNNVLVTSHQGFFTKDALQNIAKTTLENIDAYFSDRPLENEICYRCEEPTCRKERVGRCF